MRLAVTLDKLERGFTNFSDLQPNRRFGRRSRLMFPSSQTLPTDTIDMKAVLRRAFICLLLVAALYAGIIFLFVTAIAVTTVFLFLHRIHHLHWRLLKLIYKFAFHVFFNHDPPMQYVFIILVSGVLGLVWLILFAVGLEPPRGSLEPRRSSIGGRSSCRVRRLASAAERT